MYWTYYWGMHMFWWIFWLLLVVVFAFVVMRTGSATGEDEAIDTLRHHFASGDIDEGEYRRRLAILSEPGTIVHRKKSRAVAATPPRPTRTEGRPNEPAHHGA